MNETLIQGEPSYQQLKVKDNEYDKEKIVHKNIESLSSSVGDSLNKYAIIHQNVQSVDTSFNQLIELIENLTKENIAMLCSRECLKNKAEFVID